MRSFNDSIGQMLWPERREKDPRIGDKVPGPSLIQRTTARSYIKVPAGYLPSSDFTVLMGWSSWLRHVLHDWLPWLFTTDGDVQIGPIPKGTPVGLISNIQLLAESPRLEDKVAHVKKLLPLLARLKIALESLPASATDAQAEEAFRPLVPELLAVSKCPDFIINKGHYFGTNLGDDDKNALIEFLKTF
jgi:hypothetical protein